jgi:hypothetical protein
MNRIWLTLLIAVCPAVAGAQGYSSARRSADASAPYQPAVPSPSATVYGGGWGGYNNGGGTVAGSALSGMSQVISSAGQYNLSTSAAAVNMTQAEHNQLQNDMLATNTYFEMRAVNRAAKEAERGPRPSMEQAVRIAKMGIPKPLSASQWDAVDGKLFWPDALQDASFAEDRGTVDESFKKLATYGGLPYSDQTTVRHSLEAMAGQLKAQIQQMPAMDFMACRNYLSSLMYAATKTQL